MKITNKHNLPQPILNAVRASFRIPPSFGERVISVTTLIKPPRLVMLERTHWDDLETDAMDNIWSLWGSSIHAEIEKHDVDALVKEERFRLRRGEWEISGQIDRLSEDGVLQDYKTASVWSVIYGKAEWEQQPNLYAHLLRHHKYEVRSAEIVAFLRDWNRNGALKHDYPKTPVVTIPIRLWSEDEVLSFIDARLAIFDAAMTELPLCSAEDRWAKADTWAVVKKGNKRADRVLNSEAEAEVYIGYAHDGLGGKYEIQHRRGDSVRCRSYCSVSTVCTQWAKLREELDGNDDPS